MCKTADLRPSHKRICGTILSLTLTRGHCPSPLGGSTARVLAVLLLL